MAYQTPLTIRKTLQRIGSKNFVLPAIQCEFVWAREPERICRLFDSILWGYPVGTVLYWDVTPEFLQKFGSYKFMRDWHEKDYRPNSCLAVCERCSLVAIKGTLRPAAKGGWTMVPFDSLPGGPPHGRRTADRQPCIGGVHRVTNYDGGSETSCHKCLRSYRPSPIHGRLERGVAIDQVKNAGVL